MKKKDAETSQDGSSFRSHASSKTAKRREQRKKKTYILKSDEKKYRGGAPPSAPPFDGDTSKNSRAWTDWKEKVDDYVFVIKNYMPLSEAAMYLRNALSGDAYSSIKHIPRTEYLTDGGIEILVEALRVEFEQKDVYYTGDVL